jgi:hypothetical protein
MKKFTYATALLVLACARHQHFLSLFFSSVTAIGQGWPEGREPTSLQASQTPGPLMALVAIKLDLSLPG